MSSLPVFRYRDVVGQLFNVAVLGRLRFRFELVPYEATGFSLRKRANLFLAGLNQILPRPVPFGSPAFAQIEPVNFCNLSCPLCLTVSETAARPKAMLSFDQFARIIDEVGGGLLLVVLWNWGEPFLNPDICRMIAYARAKGILVHASTNGSFALDEARAGQLVESGLNTLIVGVDGATPETYQAYRRGGNLDRVWETIRTIRRVREARSAATPRLNLRFVVMRHNEHEIPLIRERARELGVDFLSFKTVDMPEARGHDLDPSYAPGQSQYRRYQYSPGGFTRSAQRFVCYRPWKRMTVDAAGVVIACEFDYRNEVPFGTIGSEASPLAVWKGKAAAAFRRTFNGGWNDASFCRACTVKDRVADDCTVEIVDLRDHGSRAVPRADRP